MNALTWFGAFAGEHPFLAFCLIWLVGCTFSTTAKLINRVLRTVKVASRGWPPEHLDADGDWKPEPEESK